MKDIRLPMALLALTGLCVQCGPVGDAAKNTPQPACVTTSSGVPILLMPGGAFVMGSDQHAADEAPAHEVRVSAFAMDVYEVTQDQYAALELPNPAHYKAPRRPVEQVRWSDAALFCNERSRHEGLEPCYDEVGFACDFEASGYRLPTEAEWEYAARAGSDTDYDFGSAASKLKNYACFADNAAKGTDPVGRKRSNRWGVHDLYGNVYEWCHDVYDAGYYAVSPVQDPRGPGAGKKRVLRGGAWNSGADACRVAARFADDPGITDACFARDTIGFRCVRRLNEEEIAMLGQ
ncbi:MAG: SUMF1/EgtB/PvdO family nonheme iron enzyme [Nitrospiraceae bacterium]|nr:SUMF1/EgtB/PvdO family nonheme iron enzyme [Nitrospiraceae bacterium]